jgi:hypothetical protein
MSSIAPEVWGPPFWAAIHLSCLAAPKVIEPEREAGFRQFFASLQHVLPCKKCRVHMAENLAALPLDASAFAKGRDSLFAWSVALHNRVNAANGKPEMPAEAARALWTSIANGKVAYMSFEAEKSASASASGSAGAPAGIKKKEIPRWVILVIAFAAGYLIAQLAGSRGGGLAAVKQRRPTAAGARYA